MAILLGGRVKCVFCLSSSTGHLNPNPKVFVLGIIAVSMYLVVIGLMVVGRNHYFREDGTCMIGLKHYASVALLVYDL